MSIILNKTLNTSCVNITDYSNDNLPSKLPNECFLKIFDYLLGNDLMTIRASSQSFYKLIKEKNALLLKIQHFSNVVKTFNTYADKAVFSFAKTVRLPFNNSANKKEARNKFYSLLIKNIYPLIANEPIHNISQIFNSLESPLRHRIGYTTVCDIGVGSIRMNVYDNALFGSSKEYWLQFAIKLAVDNENNSSLENVEIEIEKDKKEKLVNLISGPVHKVNLKKLSETDPSFSGRLPLDIED